MSQYENTNKIDREREQCRVAFKQVDKNELMSDYYALALNSIFMEPNTTMLSNKDKVDYISKAVNYLNKVLNMQIDPKFMQTIDSTQIVI